MAVMHGRSAALMLALVILAIVIHASALGGFFLYDDPIVLEEAIRQSTPDLLFNPVEYTHLSTASFTPVVLLSFKLDWQLHGADPRVFYIDQLLVLIAAALLAYLLLRRYVPDLYAALGTAIFITSWAAIYAARTLMIRHYIDGLAFALAAMLVWRRSKILAAVLYLLAMLSKEVYAPIPLFFICDARLEGRRWRDIARDLIAPAIAAIVFLVWRSRMTEMTAASELIPGQSKLMELPRALWVHLTGPEAPMWAQAIWTICLIVALALFIWRFRLRAIAVLAASLIVMLLPILPLSANFEWRYSFAFVFFSIAVVTIAAGTSGKRWAIGVLALLFATTLVTSFQQRRYYEDLTRNGIALEGRYFWTQSANAPAIAAASPEWYIGGLRWIRKYDRRGDGPPAVYSRYAITVGGMDPARIMTVSRGRIVPITSTNTFGTPAEWHATRTRFDPTVPLSVEFAVRNHDAQWKLGPPGARFVFLTDPDYTAIPIPPVGKQHVPVPREPQRFRIVREQSDGRWTVSPSLPIPAEGSVTVWKGH